MPQKRKRTISGGMPRMVGCEASKFQKATERQPSCRDHAIAASLLHWLSQINDASAVERGILSQFKFPI
jgi:hypothetical protein